MKLLSILIPQTVHKTTSQFSGEIKVIDHVFERRLVVGGLTQSGGIVKGMWERALRECIIQNSEFRIKNVLVLGLGAGTVVKVINEKWPHARIVGVETDPEIIDVGKKLFQLGEMVDLEIITYEASKFLNNTTMKQFNNFDLIIVDLYKGYSIEKKLQNEVFLRKIALKLAKNGIVIFNVLSGQNDNFEAMIFLDKLQIIFQDNFCKRISSNYFFFCANPRLRRGELSPKEVILSMAKKRKKKKRR